MHRENHNILDDIETYAHTCLDTVEAPGNSVARDDQRAFEEMNERYLNTIITGSAV